MQAQANKADDLKFDPKDYIVSNLPINNPLITTIDNNEGLNGT